MTHDSRTNNRTYLETHGWLTFILDMKAAGYGLWMNLGAAESKCEHVANTMLPPEVAQELFVLYFVKGVRATTAIEGNTLTEEQIRGRLLKNADELPKSQQYQGQEVDNMIRACNSISERIVSGADCRLSVDDIRQYNQMILTGLPLDEGIDPGQIRTYSVGVGRYRGAPAEDCEYLLERMCQWLNDLGSPKEDDHKIAFGVLRAIMAHLYIAWIHPFGDGNGRTARLLEYHLLLASGVPAVSAHLLSNHYNRTRSEYYRHLDLARSSPLAFVEYAVQGMVDSLNFQIKRIRRHQYAMTWKEFVYDKFRNQHTISARRQRKVALALGSRTAPVPLSVIRTLTTELAVEYANKTAKTVSRDVTALVQMGIVHRIGRGVLPRRQALSGFLPDRRDKSKWF